MELRAARETDIPGIRDVANRSLAASYDDVLDAESRQRAVETWYGTEGTGAFAEGLAEDRTVVVVAEANDEILGFAQAFVSGDAPVTGQIEWLHVRPGRRGEGVAEQLLDRVESDLRDADATRIEARVIEANETGREFYEAHGYTAERTRRVRLAGDHIVELTLVAEDGAAETPTERTEHRETDDGETVLVAYDERERGSEGPFHPTYLDEKRQEPYGWYCGACGSLDVNVGSMDEFVCDDCGNRRRPMRWDAAYGG